MNPLGLVPRLPVSDQCGKPLCGPLLQGASCRSSPILTVGAESFKVGQMQSRRNPTPRVRTTRTGPAVLSSVDELAARVEPGARITIGGFHFSRQPIALVEAIADRGTSGLTHANWGGSLALEILLERGLVDHLVFCFSSLEIFGMAPNFRSALEQGSVTHEEYTALEFNQALAAQGMNLAELPMQAPAGSWRHQGTGDLVSSPAIDLDIVLIHAQRADRRGNVEIAGAQGMDRSLAFAGRRVLVTVEEFVDRLDDRCSVIPRQFVEAIAEVPGGAWPESCLPYYAADFGEILRRCRQGTFAAGGEATVAQRCRTIGATPWSEVAWPTPLADLPDDPIADLMVTWLARQLDDESVCSVGSASSFASVAYLAAKASHAPHLTLLSHNGGLIDPDARFASLSMGEAADQQSAAGWCGGEDSYRWYYQQGRVTHEVVGAGQIDGNGRTNNGWINRSGGQHLRLPGQGGMADVANMHRNFLLYAPRQSPRQLVETVDWVSASRGVMSAEDRERLGYGPGVVELITDLGLFRLSEESGRMELVSIHPGVSLDDVQSATGFDFAVAESLETTPVPTPDELEAVQRVDPFGLRYLERLPARARLDAIEAVLHHETEYLKGIDS